MNAPEPHLDAAPQVRPDSHLTLHYRISLARSFWLVRHADDGRVARLSRFADLLVAGVRREVARLESMT